MPATKTVEVTDREAWQVSGLRQYLWTIMMNSLRKIPPFIPSPVTAH
jgi:hypothetical protein